VIRTYEAIGIIAMEAEVSQVLDSPLRVMIVEDNPATRERFAEALANDARVSLVAESATVREAKASIRDACPDVILVDLGLPDGHGTEVIEFAVRSCPQCDVMVITMFGDESNVIASIEAGASGYVLKDASAETLVASIIELHAGGAPMSPGIARLLLRRMRANAHESRDLNRSAQRDGTLTERETDVLNALSRGYTYAEVADRLGISPHTVTTHIKNSYRKLAVHTAAAAVTRAAELGLLLKADHGPRR